MRYLFTSLLLLAACGASEFQEPVFKAGGELTIYSRDKSETVDVLAWNIEWFGSTREGPSDEKLQQDRARDILNGLSLEIYGLVEITSKTAFDAMLAGMPNYHGLIANDLAVENGVRFYSVSEQKPALILKRDITIQRARLILTENAGLFGGRPPLEASLRTTIQGQTRTLTVIVVHFKALTDRDSYELRKQASVALKNYLDREHPSRWVLVIGDFNDDLFRSTRAGQPSPFQNFVEDRARYRFITENLSRNGISTTVSFSATIDHHLATDELAARNTIGAEVLPMDRIVRDYGDTVSDHYPVLTRYDLR